MLNHDNDASDVVGFSVETVVLSCLDAVLDPSTWAMMLAGFVGLGFAGYRRAKAGGALQLTNLS